MIIDVEILRIIFIVLGVIIVLGIYFWERWHQNYDNLDETGWQEPHSELTDSIIINDNFNETQQTSQYLIQDKDLDRSMKALSELANEPNETRSNKRDNAIQMPINPKDKIASEDDNDYWNIGTPPLVVQLNISAKNDPFNGPRILQVLEKVGCKINDHGIFNYYIENDNEALFSVVSMVRPGAIPVQGLDDFKTPGLTMFSEISGFGDGIALFSKMLSCAKIIASELNGELQDDNRSKLTNQIVEHINSQILEHQRQIQLAVKRYGKI